MEELLIYLLFFIIYLAAQFLGARKKKRQPTPATGDASDDSFSLEDALQEIREAMGSPASGTEPTVPPLDEHRRTEPERSSSIPRPTLSRPAAKPPAAALPVEPLAVERRDSGMAPPVTPPRTAHPPGTRRPRSVRPGLRTHLSSREALRDAFVLSEIFGPPRALRR